MTPENENQKHDDEANYETECVGLWLSNDEGEYLAIQEMIEAAPDRKVAAQALEAYVTQNNPLAGTDNLYSELLTTSLDNVDWEAVISYWDE